MTTVTIELRPTEQGRRYDVPVPARRDADPGGPKRTRDPVDLWRRPTENSPVSEPTGPARMKGPGGLLVGGWDGVRTGSAWSTSGCDRGSCSPSRSGSPVDEHPTPRNASGPWATLYERSIRPETGLPFVNADEIARAIAGGGPITREISVEAAILAARRRDALIANGASFVAETVFSHPSKVELVHNAKAAGYDVRLHVVVIPVALSVLRVQTRVESGGHDVPEDKIRQRHERLWAHVAQAVSLPFRSQTR